MRTTSIRLQPDLESSLEEQARKLQRSKNWLINQAIRSYLEKTQLDDKRWKETLEALESVRDGQGVSEEKVDGWLKSWGTKNEGIPPGQ